MRIILFLSILISFSNFSWSQSIDKLINVKEVERIESTLASDAMGGRATFSPYIDKAADFISSEFKKAGIQPLNGKSYLQKFEMVEPSFVSMNATLNKHQIESKKVIVFTAKSDLSITEQSGFKVIRINKDTDFFNKVQNLAQLRENAIVLVDSSFAKVFPRLVFFKKHLMKSDKSVAFILTNEMPKTFTIEAKHAINTVKLANVVGVIPGKKRKDEYVIFSSHYDHLGIDPSKKGDSIFNGANDDAAGTTAVITLANYFKKLNNNERSLIFVAFTAEEIGGFGSQYFSIQLNPDKVAAMFNIEMIGTESKWGENSAFITGFEKSNMGTILKQNLKGGNFQFYADPYIEQNLFYRSDNATLAKLGVPAHTICTAQMDNDLNYHKASDEVKTLSLKNMTNIIKAIAISSGSIISGKDTPSRLEKVQ